MLRHGGAIKWSRGADGRGQRDRRRRSGRRRLARHACAAGGGWRHNVAYGRPGHAARVHAARAARRDPRYTCRIVIRVLVAEDQAMVLGALCALLEDERDLEVVGRAQSGSEAIDLVERVRPDVVVSDIEMPGVSGLDLAGELRRRGHKARVIILTTDRK